MIEILFVCMLGEVKKGIKVERLEKGCYTYVDTKIVGSSKYRVDFCRGLAGKVKSDMERKGYVCKEP